MFLGCCKHWTASNFSKWTIKRSTLLVRCKDRKGGEWLYDVLLILARHIIVPEIILGFTAMMVGTYVSGSERQWWASGSAQSLSIFYNALKMFCKLLQVLVPTWLSIPTGKHAPPCPLFLPFLTCKFASATCQCTCLARDRRSTPACSAVML